MKGEIKLTDTLFNLRGVFKRMQAAGLCPVMQSDKLVLKLDEKQIALVLSMLVPVQAAPSPAPVSIEGITSEEEAKQALEELGFYFSMDIDTDEHRHYLVCKSETNQVLIGINEIVENGEFSFDQDENFHWHLFKKYDMRVRYNLSELLAVCVLRIKEANLAEGSL